LVPAATFALIEPERQPGSPILKSHYVRSLYLIASEQHRISPLLEAFASDEAATLMDVEEIREVEPSVVPSERRRLLKPSGEGVLWCSGRVFFPPA
jgi:hypothetical protein